MVVFFWLLVISEGVYHEGHKVGKKGQRHKADEEKQRRRAHHDPGEPGRRTRSRKEDTEEERPKKEYRNPRWGPHSQSIAIGDP